MLLASMLYRIYQYILWYSSVLNLCYGFLEVKTMCYDFFHIIDSTYEMVSR